MRYGLAGYAGRTRGSLEPMAAGMC